VQAAIGAEQSSISRWLSMGINTHPGRNLFALSAVGLNNERHSSKWIGLTIQSAFYSSVHFGISGERTRPRVLFPAPRGKLSAAFNRQSLRKKWKWVRLKKRLSF
jgi:hypothetical protein